MTCEDLRTQDKSIISLFSASILSILTSQLCFHTSIYIQSIHCWMLRKIQFVNTSFHPLREDKERQTNVTLRATGSYKYYINTLKNAHKNSWKHFFFKVSSQAHFLRFHFTYRSLIFSTSTISNQNPATVITLN